MASLIRNLIPFLATADNGIDVYRWSGDTNLNYHLWRHIFYICGSLDFFYIYHSAYHLSQFHKIVICFIQHFLAVIFEFLQTYHRHNDQRVYASHFLHLVEIV